LANSGPRVSLQLGTGREAWLIKRSNQRAPTRLATICRVANVVLEKSPGSSSNCSAADQVLLRYRCAQKVAVGYASVVTIDIYFRPDGHSIAKSSSSPLNTAAYVRTLRTWLDAWLGEPNTPGSGELLASSQSMGPPTGLRTRRLSRLALASPLRSFASSVSVAPEALFAL
jgi:hypothetical protein